MRFYGTLSATVSKLKLQIFLYEGIRLFLNTVSYD